MKESKIILGVGHPRTGTGYTSNLLKSWGLDVGHERMGKDGIVAWQLVSNVEPRIYMENFNASKYKYQYVIYSVRNPKNSIPSVALTETKTAGYRFQSFNSFNFSNDVENAVRSIIEWDRLVRAMNPDFVFRIEDQSKDLHSFLISKNIEVSDFKDTLLRNERNHAGYTAIEKDLLKIPEELKQGLNEYCERYGYPKLF